MTRPISTVCAWCVAEGSVPRPEEEVSHGVCDRHLAQSLAELDARLDTLPFHEREERLDWEENNPVRVRIAD